MPVLQPPSRRMLAAALLPLLAVGCIVPVPEPYYAACDAIGASEWTAEVQIFLSSHPKPVKSRRLIVTGKVVLPRGGYSVTLVRGPVARLDPPVQQLMVHSVAPAGEAESRPTTYRLRAEVPALKRYGGVEIRCGDGVIARIPNVAVPPRA